MKVLVAEDDTILQRLLQNYLAKWGHEVVMTSNGQAAWEAFDAHPFPLLITDWMMPLMDGVELIHRLRSREPATFVYVILLTARSQTEDIVRGMEAGADDFLVKPFDRDELRVRIRAGERIVLLEQALRQARDGLERRVEERTSELATANEALQVEIAEHQRAARELQAAQEQLIRGEIEKKRFYREVIRAVTQEKFNLVDREDIPLEGDLLFNIPLVEPNDYRLLRNQLRERAKTLDMTAEAIGDVVLAAGEAATNAMKHGIEGGCDVYLAPNRLITRVSDHGPGILSDNLASTILKPGFSTKVSLGMGYTLMLELVDRIWLATGPEGTVVQIEKFLRPEEQLPSPLLAVFERF